MRVAGMRIRSWSLATVAAVAVAMVAAAAVLGLWRGDLGWRLGVDVYHHPLRSTGTGVEVCVTRTYFRTFACATRADAESAKAAWKRSFPDDYMLCPAGLRLYRSVGGVGSVTYLNPGHVIARCHVDVDYNLDIHLPWLLCGPALVAAIAGWGLLRSRRVGTAGRCRRCGYDLRATPERCPQCGAAASV